MNCDLFLLLALAVRPTDQQLNYIEWPQAGLVRGRLVEICRKYYLESSSRIAACHDMRFMYEESPHYEMGYLIGEIVERYRKMVEIALWVREYEADTVFAALHRLELQQKLYFEVYHLVHMMHEIERKYKHMPEFRDITQKLDYEQMSHLSSHLASQSKWREKERLKRQKKLKRLRDAMANRTVTTFQRKPKKATAFPIDYGWEIDKEAWA